MDGGNEEEEEEEGGRRGGITSGAPEKRAMVGVGRYSDVTFSAKCACPSSDSELRLSMKV